MLAKVFEQLDSSEKQGRIYYTSLRKTLKLIEKKTVLTYANAITGGCVEKKIVKKVGISEEIFLARYLPTFITMFDEFWRFKVFTYYRDIYNIYVMSLLIKISKF